MDAAKSLDLILFEIETAGFKYLVGSDDDDMYL
jgi:hypothetical protein